MGIEGLKLFSCEVFTYFPYHKKTNVQKKYTYIFYIYIPCVSATLHITYNIINPN